MRTCVSRNFILPVLALLVATCARPPHAQAGAQPDGEADLSRAQATNAFTTEATPATGVAVVPAGDRPRSLRQIIWDELDQRLTNNSLINRGDIVLPGQDLVLRSNEYAGQVVAFGGNVRIEGIVQHDVLAFGGNVTVDGSVGNNVVAFGGNVILGDGARIGRDIVPLGGRVERSPTSQIGGRVSSQLPLALDW